MRVHPEASIAEIAAATSLSKRVVYYHVKSLLDAKLLSSSTPERFLGLRPTDLLELLTERERPS